MKMFLDTSQPVFAIAIFDDEFNLLIKETKEIVFKVEALTQFIEKNKVELEKIKEIYLNIGPGSFTGTRVSITYAKTIAQLSNCKIFTINSFYLSFLTNKENKEQIIFINKFKSLSLENKNLNKIDKTKIIKTDEKDITKIDYQKIINNFIFYSKNFTYVDDLSNLNPLYILDPQIGGNK